MFKRFNDFIINERFHEELNNDIERYIFYTKDFDENEMKKIYKILFNKGYKLGDVNDVKDLNEENLHISFMIISVNSKYILYSTNPNIENNINSIAYYLTEIGMGSYEYYFIKDKKDFDNIFNVLSINTYFNSRNVYESLLDKLKGPTDEEIINKLKDSPKKLFTKSVYMGFLLGVETAIKTGEITQNEKNIALIDASSYGYYDIVELLLKNGADPSYLDNRAFMLAGSNGHKDVTELLIKYKNKGLKESLLNNNSDIENEYNRLLFELDILKNNSKTFEEFETLVNYYGYRINKDVNVNELINTERVSGRPIKTSGPINVVEDIRNGRLYIIDGHNRTQEAKNNNQEKINAIVSRGIFTKKGNYFNPEVYVLSNKYNINLKEFYNEKIKESVTNIFDKHDNYDGYIIYTKDLDIDIMKYIFKTLFDNGYFYDSKNDVEYLNQINLEKTFLLIMKKDKIIRFSNHDLQNNSDEIGRFLSSCGFNYKYYLFNNLNEFNRIFNPLKISDYFKPNINVYESLLDKLEGPTEEEIDKKFNELVENDEEEKALNFALKLKNDKYIIKVMKEFGVSANEVLEKVIDSLNYGSLSFDNLLKSYDFIFNLDYEELFNLFNKAHSSFKEVFIKYIKDESVLNGLLIDNAINNNNGTVGIIIRNTKDLDYNEALVKACEYGSDDVIKMLLGATSADIHYNNDEALWYAIDNGKYSTIKILLENGANLYARNNNIIQTIKNYYSKTTKVYELLKSYDRKNLL